MALGFPGRTRCESRGLIMLKRPVLPNKGDKKINKVHVDVAWKGMLSTSRASKAPYLGRGSIGAFVKITDPVLTDDERKFVDKQVASGKASRDVATAIVIQDRSTGNIFNRG